MQVTKENLNLLPEKERNFVEDILDYELEEINSFNKGIFTLHWQDYHDEYSPERTDPCPDYYGYYTLRFERVLYETVGSQMTIDELDNALCMLYCYNHFQNTVD